MTVFTVQLVAIYSKLRQFDKLLSTIFIAAKKAKQIVPMFGTPAFALEY
jgi:hypothetical protein